MKSENIEQSVCRQLIALEQMSAPELEEKWKDLFGRNPPEYGKVFMKRRLAHRIQELFYGGLSEEIKAKFAEVQNPKRRSKGILRVGARLIREWHDQKFEVTVRSSGYEYNGTIYRSLTAVAKAITGAHWNGKIFFGIKESK